MSRVSTTRVMILILMFCASAQTVGAQTPARPSLDSLRNKSELTPGDLDQLDEYFKSQISRLQSDVGNPSNIRTTQEQMISEYKIAGNSPIFRRRYAERLAVVFVQERNGLSPDAEHAVLGTLIALTDLETLPGFQAAMESSNVASRTMALQGIAGLREKWVADPAKYIGLMKSLGPLAAKEDNPIVLSLIYQCFNAAINKEDQARNLLAILESRYQTYANGPAISCAPEEVAWVRMLDLCGAFNEADQIQLVRVAAQYLTLYTHQSLYGNRSSEGRVQLQVGAALCERLLAKVTKEAPPNGGLASALGLSASERAAKILTALFFWVGSKDATGKLNAGKWQVPVGGIPTLDFTAPVPEITPAPSEKPAEDKKNP